MWFLYVCRLQWSLHKESFAVLYSKGGLRELHLDRFYGAACCIGPICSQVLQIHVAVGNASDTPKLVILSKAGSWTRVFHELKYCTIGTRNEAYKHYFYPHNIHLLVNTSVWRSQEVFFIIRLDFGQKTSKRRPWSCLLSQSGEIILILHSLVVISAVVVAP